MSAPDLDRYDKFAFGYDHLCVSVVKGMTLAEALDKLGLTAEPLGDRDEFDEDPDVVWLGEVGGDLVTFDVTGAGRFELNLWELAGDRPHGQAQWDDYNAAVYFRTAGGRGFGWDVEQDDPEPSSYPEYDELLADPEDLEGGHRTVMLAILDRELGIRLDEVEPKLTHSVDLSVLRRAGS